MGSHAKSLILILHIGYRKDTKGPLAKAPDDIYDILQLFAIFYHLTYFFKDITYFKQIEIGTNKHLENNRFLF